MFLMIFLTMGLAGSAHGITAMRGRSVTLPCDTAPGVRVARVLWLKAGEPPFLEIVVTGSGLSIYRANDRVGVPDVNDPSDFSLTIADVTDEDAGEYVCVYAIIPSQKEMSARVSLRVVSVVELSVDIIRVKESPFQKILAECTGIAEDEWVDAEWDTNITALDWTAGRPEYFVGEHRASVHRFMGIPREEFNGQWVTCTGTSNTLEVPLIARGMLVIDYSPRELTFALSPEGELSCAGRGSPSPTIAWEGADGDRLTPNATGLYKCEATNGVGSAEIFVYVQDAAECQACGALIGLVGLLGAGLAGLVLWLLRNRKVERPWSVVLERESPLTTPWLDATTKFFWKLPANRRDPPESPRETEPATA